MEVRKGYVEHIVFRNKDNGYTVFQLVSEGEELTCVGTFLMLAEGDFVQVNGTLKTHPLYGEQLSVQQLIPTMPEDEGAVERYLGSGAIKGIKAALASRIVRRFKGDTIRIMEEEPERLSEIKGISERKAREIGEQMEEKKELRQVMIFLTRYGISMSLAAKIYQKYGQRTYQVLKENPYRLADDISGVGDALLGRRAVGVNGAEMLESQVHNATIALSDIFESFTAFTMARNEKSLAV